MTLAGTRVRSADGVEIACVRRPGAGRIPLVLVHGTSAHAGWWEHIPLPERYAVVALDLAGHGESGRRSAYSLQTWADDVLAVVDSFDEPGPTVGSAGPAGPASGPMVGSAGSASVVLVGHSVGGLVAAHAAIARPAAVAGVVLVDSIVVDPEVVEPWHPPRAGRIFPSLDEVVARFRLTPPQPEADPDILRRIALGSVREVPGGWAWKVDPLIFGAVGRPGMAAGLEDLPCPVAVVRGELSSLVGPTAGADLAARLGRPVPQLDVPGAHHHLMIDHPTELAAALHAALEAL